MAAKDWSRELKKLQKSGFVVPGLDGKGKAQIPKIPALVECPDCGQRIPVFVQVQNLTFAVSYPIRKEEAGRRVRIA